MPDIGRLIGLAAKRHGREIGRIGLDQHRLKRHAPGHFPHFRRVLEGDNAGERYQKILIHRGGSRLPVFNEAVHHAADLARALFSQYPDHVLPGLPAMNDQWFIDLFGGDNMGAETIPLPFKIAAAAKIIQPGLAYRHHFFGGGQPDQVLHLDFLPQLCIGMRADRGRNVGMLPGEFDDRGRAFEIDGHTEHLFNPVLRGIVEHGLNRQRFGQQGDMAVRINQRGRGSFFCHD